MYISDNFHFSSLIRDSMSVPSEGVSKLMRSWGGGFPNYAEVELRVRTHVTSGNGQDTMCQ